MVNFKKVIIILLIVENVAVGKHERRIRYDRYKLLRMYMTELEDQNLYNFLLQSKHIIFLHINIILNKEKKHYLGFF